MNAPLYQYLGSVCTKHFFKYRLVSHYTEQYSLELSVSQIFMIEDFSYQCSSFVMLCQDCASCEWNF